MRCVKCGQKLISGQSFCPTCGAKISLQTPSEETNKQDQNTSNNNFRRVEEGAVIYGVCKGLEVSGKGPANLWRLLFVSLYLPTVGGAATGFPIVGLGALIYAGMTIGIPIKKSEEDSNNSLNLDRLDSEY